MTDSDCAARFPNPGSLSLAGISFPLRGVRLSSSATRGPRLAAFYVPCRALDGREARLTASPRLAVNPLNAMLNYLYALLESEARLAVAALGLDPGLGVMHFGLQGSCWITRNKQHQTRKTLVGSSRVRTAQEGPDGRGRFRAGSCYRQEFVSDLAGSAGTRSGIRTQRCCGASRLM